MNQIHIKQKQFQLKEFQVIIDELTKILIYHSIHMLVFLFPFG